MTKLITALFLLTCLCCHAQRTDQFAQGMRGTDPRYFPPGYARSLFWWKFSETSGTNIADYSAVGTNTAYAQVNGGGNGTWFTNNCFNAYCSASTVNTSQWFLSQSANIGHGASMATSNGFTVSVWVLMPYALVAGTGTTWPILQCTHNAAAGTVSGIALWYQNTLNPPYRITGSINQNQWNGANIIYKQYTAATLTNAWHNLTFTASPVAGTKLYVDGAVQATGAWVTQTNVCSKWYGCYDYITGGANRWLQGYIDDCYLTTYVFTDADATNHFLQGRSQ